MQTPFETWYEPRLSLTGAVAELSDPALSLSSAPQDAKRLILNLAIKYLARSIGASDESDATRLIGELQENFIRLSEQRDGEILANLLAWIQDRLPTELFSIKCLGDLQKSATLIQEIIFGSTFQPEEHQIVLDLGTGTGVLLLAGIISSYRQGICNLTGFGSEHSTAIAERAGLLLSNITRPGTDIHISTTSLLDKKLYTQELPSVRGNVRLWISETIQEKTSVAYANGSISHNSWRAWFDYLGAKGADPYFDAVKLSLQHLPNFAEDVSSGRTSMFPDIINGRYRAEESGSIRLVTSSDCEFSLRNLSAPYALYQTPISLGKRW